MQASARTHVSTTFCGLQTYKNVAGEVWVSLGDGRERVQREPPQALVVGEKATDVRGRTASDAVFRRSKVRDEGNLPRFRLSLAVRDDAALTARKRLPRSASAWPTACAADPSSSNGQRVSSPAGSMASGCCAPSQAGQNGWVQAPHRYGRSPARASTLERLVTTHRLRIGGVLDLEPGRRPAIDVVGAKGPLRNDALGLVLAVQTEEITPAARYVPEEPQSCLDVKRDDLG